MDYDRVAAFLSRCTSQKFRRSLQVNPSTALCKCGFDPVEAARLTASLTRTEANDTHELERFAFSFSKITFNSAKGKKSSTDDWDVVP